jgi:hypothetical protein
VLAREGTKEAKMTDVNDTRRQYEERSAEQKRKQALARKLINTGFAALEQKHPAALSYLKEVRRKLRGVYGR